jgi:hypothetical protein
MLPALLVTCRAPINNNIVADSVPLCHDDIIIMTSHQWLVFLWLRQAALIAGRQVCSVQKVLNTDIT